MIFFPTNIDSGNPQRGMKIKMESWFASVSGFHFMYVIFDQMRLFTLFCSASQVL